MKHIRCCLRSVSRSCLALLLGFSILISTISAPVTYSATPIAIPATWTLIEWLFLSLGVSISITDGLEVTEDEMPDYISEQLEELYANYTDPEFVSPIETLIEYVSNITDYWSDTLEALVIPQDDWAELEEFFSTHILPSCPTVISDAPILSGCNREEFYSWYSEVLGIDTSSLASTYYLDKHKSLVYDSFVENNYSGFFYGPNENFAELYPGEMWFSFIPIEPGTAYCTVEFYDGYSIYAFCEGTSYAYSLSTARYYYNDNKVSWCADDIFRTNYNEISALYINGVAYDFWSVFGIPSDTTTDEDYGSTVYSDVLFETVFDEIQTIPQSGVSDAYENDAYDVLTPGRELEDDGTITGDVVLGIPSDDVLEKYINGDITWTDVLASADVVPVDTTAGTTMTGESTKDVYYAEFASLEESVRSLPQLLLDGIAALFVPSEGFFEEWFTDMMAFFKDKLGFIFVPFDLMIDFITMLYEAEPGDAVLQFPGIYYMEYTIVEPQEVSLDYSEHFPDIYKYIKFGTSIVMIGWVIHLAYLKYEKVVNN